jgi:hypothetical protein
MKSARSYYLFMGWIFAALLVLGLEAAATIELTQRAREGLGLEPGLGTRMSHLK